MISLSEHLSIILLVPPEISAYFFPTPEKTIDKYSSGISSKYVSENLSGSPHRVYLVFFIIYLEFKEPKE